jgi:hypothetical protein
MAFVAGDINKFGQWHTETIPSRGVYLYGHFTLPTNSILQINLPTSLHFS